jgi:hypothetical protein
VPTLARRTGAVALLALSLAVAGCSSSGSTSEATQKPAAPQGADPVAWTGALCKGIGQAASGVTAIAKSQPTPQGQKDGILAFSDAVQQAFSGTAQSLKQLGPPRVTDGKKIQESAVSFFTGAAGTISEQREKFAALDPNAPDFVEKASHLPGPDLGALSSQIQSLTTNPQLMPAFKASPDCQKLSAPATPK